MKLPDLYRDWRVVGGLALALLGAGNWTVGLHKAQQAGAMISRAANVAPSSDYRSFEELDSGAGAVLKPFTREQERVSYATARMDFYHVTFLSGQVMVVAGTILLLIGFINVIQRDTRHMLRRIERPEPPSNRGTV